MLRLAVVYNQPECPPAHPLAESEWEIVEVAKLVAEELRVPGWQPELIALGKDEDWQSRIIRHRPDIVFNLFEGFVLEKIGEELVPAFLESLGIPYTGNDARTLQICRNKPLTRETLKSYNLPVAQGAVVTRLEGISAVLEGLRGCWPLLVKPAMTDASAGIDQSSIVESPEQLEKRCAALLGQYGPVLIEEFLPGREFNVSVVDLGELEVLPISEIVFSSEPGFRWPVVTYDAKWKPGSLADRCTTPVCPAEVPDPLRSELERVASNAFYILGCKQYARIDIRLDKKGQPRILEVNPNPGYHPESGFSRALQAAGWTHAGFSRALVRHALQCAPRRS